MKITFSLNEIEEVARKILNQETAKVILFNGEMGVGKTTLIKELCKKIGIQDTTSSPTFSLVNEYQSIENETVYHFDFYRIKNEIEAMDIGVDEYFYSGNWCFIEWSEKIPNLLPQIYSIISITKLDNENRQLIVTHITS